jgi:hypothetical protein
MIRKTIFINIAIYIMLIQIACAPQPTPFSIEMANTYAQETINAILTQRTRPELSGTPLTTDIPSETLLPSNTPTQFIPTWTATPTRSSIIGTCYKILSVVDVTIPDKTQIAPGASFIKTWTLTNGGTCEWPADTRIVFASGEIMSGSAKTLGSAVSVGGNINVSLSLIAPTAPKTYRGNWMLELANGTRFGLGDSGTGLFWVEIIVSGTITPSLSATPTGSGTPTNTPTHSTSSTATSTPTTSTSSPTNTPTQPSPTNSNTPTETPSLTMTPVTPEG